MQNSHCLLCLVSGFGCNLDSTRTLPFTAQPLSIFPAEKGGKFDNFPVFGILLLPNMPDRVKPECRVNLSVDKAGKAVSRHISFYQRIPEVKVLQTSKVLQEYLLFQKIQHYHQLMQEPPTVGANTNNDAVHW